MSVFASLVALKKPETKQLGSLTNRRMLLVNKDRKLSSAVVLPVDRPLALFPPFTPVENSEARLELYSVWLSISGVS